MRRSVAHLVAAGIILTCVKSYAQAPEFCGNNQRVLDNRPGHFNSGEINFWYESRVEEFSSSAHGYSWCIFNQGNMPTFVRWGTATIDDKYFGGIVAPTKLISTFDTESADFGAGRRIIKFRRADWLDIPENWKAIERETIHPKQSSNVGTHRIVDRLVQLTQSDIDDLLIPYKTNGLIDLAKLSRNTELFRLLLQRQKVEFVKKMTFSLPTNFGALQAVEQGKYEKYTSSDFASVSVSITTLIYLDQKGPESQVFITSRPQTPEDAAALEKLSDLPIYFGISPVNPDRKLPPELSVQQKFSRNSFSKLLMDRPIGVLSPVDAVFEVKVDKSDFRIFSNQFRLLLPLPSA